MPYSTGAKRLFAKSLNEFIVWLNEEGFFVVILHFFLSMIFDTIAIAVTIPPMIRTGILCFGKVVVSMFVVF